MRRMTLCARADQADDHARDRRRPGDAVEVERRALAAAGRGQSGEEAQRVADIASGGAEAREAPDPRKAQRNMATASTPIAAKPDSTRPHSRTSARATETSRPRSDRIWLLSGAITKKAYGQLEMTMSAPNTQRTSCDSKYAMKPATAAASAKADSSATPRLSLGRHSESNALSSSAIRAGCSTQLS